MSASSYEEARGRMAAAREQMRAAFADAFRQGAAEKVFGPYPEVESFSWTQYTPGFNDGDPCTFGVHADEPEINGEEPPYDSSKPYGERYPPYVKAVADLIYSFDEDDLQHAFGDGVRVTACRDGTTEAEGYDCGY